MIIPKPCKVTELDGSFVVTPDTRILFAKGTPKGRKLSEQLSEFLSSGTGKGLEIGSTDCVAGEKNSIFLTTQNAPARLGKEGYKLTVGTKKIVIRAAGPAGLFYGVQSLRQLLPADVGSPSRVSPLGKIPCIRVEDIPRFKWRGMHLDVCRHFFDVDSIKKYIDYLAMYKMNVFHWHLTEDQGWRVEIRKYPKLAEISSWRKGTKRNYWGCKGDAKKYGGYFTHDEIREVVAYAKEHFITVVPEIEMPGHAQAALAAYPEISCTGQPYKVWTDWGISKEVFCAGNNKVFDFLEDVFDEILGLFPGKYIHIGGDECPKDRWRVCPKCQKRISREGLADEDELQSYFVQRIAQFIQARGRTVIGWDEILEGGLAKGTALMSWRGTEGGIKAAAMKHNVVMTPHQFTYLDNKPAMLADPGQGPGRDHVIDLEKVYEFEPTTGIPRKFQKYILGGQGCLWTEYVNNHQELEYMLLPRLGALAEVLWSPKLKRSWPEFRKRMKSHAKRLDALGANYCKAW